MNLILGAGFSGTTIGRKGGKVCLRLPSNFHCYGDVSTGCFTLASSLGPSAVEWMPNYSHIASIEVNDTDVQITIENLDQKQLSISCTGKRSRIVFRNNRLCHLAIYDRGQHNTLDMSQQSPLNATYNLNETTRLLQVATGAPLCFCCQENSATQAFHPCGHWGICKGCSPNMNTPNCPICRQRPTRMISLFVA
jgi:hypothetical protein